MKNRSGTSTNFDNLTSGMEAFSELLTFAFDDAIAQQKSKKPQNSSNIEGYAEAFNNFPALAIAAIIAQHKPKHLKAYLETTDKYAGLDEEDKNYITQYITKCKVPIKQIAKYIPSAMFDELFSMLSDTERAMVLVGRKMNSDLPLKYIEMLSFANDTDASAQKCIFLYAPTEKKIAPTEAFLVLKGILGQVVTDTFKGFNQLKTTTEYIALQKEFKKDTTIFLQELQKIAEEISNKSNVAIIQENIDLEYAKCFMHSQTYDFLQRYKEGPIVGGIYKDKNLYNTKEIKEHIKHYSHVVGFIKKSTQSIEGIKDTFTKRIFECEQKIQANENLPYQATVLCYYELGLELIKGILENASYDSKSIHTIYQNKLISNIAELGSKNTDKYQSMRHTMAQGIATEMANCCKYNAAGELIILKQGALAHFKKASEFIKEWVTPLEHEIINAIIKICEDPTLQSSTIDRLSVPEEQKFDELEQTNEITITRDLATKTGDQNLLALKKAKHLFNLLRNVTESKAVGNPELPYFLQELNNAVQYIKQGSPDFIFKDIRDLIYGRDPLSISTLFQSFDNNEEPAEKEEFYFKIGQAWHSNCETYEIKDKDKVTVYKLVKKLPNGAYIRISPEILDPLDIVRQKQYLQAFANSRPGSLNGIKEWYGTWKLKIDEDDRPVANEVYEFLRQDGKITKVFSLGTVKTHTTLSSILRARVIKHGIGDFYSAAEFLKQAEYGEFLKQPREQELVKHEDTIQEETKIFIKEEERSDNTDSLEYTVPLAGQPYDTPVSGAGM